MSHPPVWLRKQRPLLLPIEPKCLVTGQSAKYREPRTGQPYASVSAFARIRGAQQGLPLPPLVPQPAGVHTGPALPPSPPFVAVVDRGKEGGRSGQLRTELRQEMSKWTSGGGGEGGVCSTGVAAGVVEAALPPPRGPYDLPPDLMALVVDFAAGGGLRQARGRRQY